MSLQKEWMDKYTVKHADAKIENASFTVTFKFYETWLLTWFHHETFDVGQTDKEALDSFEQFIHVFLENCIDKINCLEMAWTKVADN